MKRRLIFAVACLALAVFADTAHGQSQASTGQIAGRVFDASGAVVPGVTVAIANEATSIRREVVTNAEGLYAFPLLPIGTYELTAKLKGFLSVREPDLHVTVGSSLRQDFTLQVGDVSDIVNVGSDPAFLDVTSPVATTTLESATIEKMPTNGRRFQDLVVLTPHAQVDIQRGQIALSGQRGVNSNISIDGADYNQPFFGGIRGGSRSNFAPTVPQEAIAEFQVIASGYSPEFGRSSGGLVNVVTKAGTNRPSGSAFYVNRHDELAARNAFGQRTAPTQHQWGGSFGGPVKRDQSFFFVAYEQQDVSAPRAVLFDALDGFVPTDATREAFDHYKNLEGPFTTTNDGVALLGRFEYHWEKGTRFDVRYGASRNVGLNAITSGNATLPTTTLALSSNGTERDQTDTVAGQFTQARRSNLLLEVRAQYSREERPREANAIAARVQTNIGRFGTTSFLPVNTLDWRGQTAASVTWIAGSHVVKAGTEIGYVAVDETVGLNQTGAFTISGTTNTDSILETLSVGGPTMNRFDSPSVIYVRQVGSLEQSMSSTEAAAFAQDSWRIGQTLTLTYGLRWEGQWHPSPDVGNRALVERVAEFTFPTGRRVDPAVVPDAPGQFAPRVGVAWTLGQDAATVVRGNAGIYYARTPGIILAGPLGNFAQPPGDLSVQLPFAVPASNPNKTVYQQLALIGIDLNRAPLADLPIITPEQIQQVVRALGLAFDPYTGAQLFVVDPDFRNPKSYQWGGGIERALAARLTVGVDYVDVRTVDLERNIDLNLPLPTVGAGDDAQRPFFGLRSGRLRPIPSLGSVIVREATARSQYRALTLRTRFQGRRGELYAFYVLGKSRSDDDNEADLSGIAVENPYDLTPEYGFARLDRRHQLSGGWVLWLPYGIEAAGSFQVRSGAPIDATFGSDVNESIAGADRPYHAPGVAFERNRFRNRSTSTMNLHVLKNVSVRDRYRLSIVIDVFNPFNSAGIQYAGTDATNYCARPVPASCGFGAPSNPNFLQLVDREPTSPTFGQYLLNNMPGEPRQIQLGLRVSF